MVALVANSSEAPIARLLLQPGINTVGRAAGNHHVIPHHSVSSRHCEIVVREDAITVRDLGSTNGTFINDQAVDQAQLNHGQRLKFGSVEFVVEVPDAATPSGPLRVNRLEQLKTVETAAAPATSHTAQDMIGSIDVAAYDEPSFYRQLLPAFAYPFYKGGPLLLALGAVFFLILAVGERLVFILRFAIRVFTLGYLFAYMQRIISSTALGEDEVPDFPDVTEIWSDIVVPFLLFTGVTLVSFAPALAVIILLHDHALFEASLGAALVVCGCYYPMALLAVAVTDNFIAVSPHVVIPSIMRLLLPYLVGCLVLAILVGLRFGMAAALSYVPIPILPTVIDGFVSLYLLIVEMRILGLLFRCYRDRLGWI
jgi:hypothetical protein